MNTPMHCPGFDKFKNLQSFTCKCNNCNAENEIFSDEFDKTLKSELKRLIDKDVKILKLYFMLGKIDGLDYFGQQEKNLENLKIGLEI